jgi:hypothetical protein
MTQLAEMNQPLEGQPNFFMGKCPLRCGSCVHFSTTPLYSSGGEKLTCASPKFGRTVKSEPCVNFAPDASKFLRYPDKVRKKIFDAMQAIEDYTVHGNRFDEAMVNVMMAAAVHRQARRKGLPLGRDVSVRKSDVLGETGVGKLIFLGNGMATILHQEGHRVTVPATEVVKADGTAPEESDGEAEVGDVAGTAKLSKKELAAKAASKTKPKPDKKPAKATKADKAKKPVAKAKAKAPAKKAAKAAPKKPAKKLTKKK